MPANLQVSSRLPIFCPDGLVYGTGLPHAHAVAGLRLPSPLEKSLFKTDTHRIAGEECKTISLVARLRKAGLRPTRQRIALAHLLFSRGDRHVSAEALHAEAQTARVPVSLATVYNTLHQFNEVGLLRAVAVESSKTYFDTNTGDHHHFYLEQEGRIVDVPASQISVTDLPEPPDGMEIARVEVIVRLRPKTVGRR